MERKEGESIQMEKESFLKRYGLLIATGLVVGAAAVLLTYFGNPANMGFCIACFLRDIAGALNFQRAGFDAEVGTGIVQYIRPEIIGLVLGSTVIAFLRKEFKPRGGSSPMARSTWGRASRATWRVPLDHRRHCFRDSAQVRGCSS